MINDIGVIKAFPIDGHPYETFPKLQSKKYKMDTPLHFYMSGLFWCKLQKHHLINNPRMS